MKYFDIVLDGNGDSPDHVFVEIEDDKGRSFRLGEWRKRDDGYVVIRVPLPVELPEVIDAERSV